MKRIISAAWVMAWMAMGVGTVGADVYKVDPAHTTIGFSIKHMVINTVKGRFNEFDGTVNFDPKDSLSFSASGSVKTKSVDTGIAARDEHLRKEDFFNVEKFPEMTFRSTQIEKKGDQYILTGVFTMLGVSKTVSAPIEINGPITDPWGKTRIGFEGVVTINRQDYGMKYSTLLDNGGLAVGNDVKIEINAEAVKE